MYMEQKLFIESCEGNILHFKKLLDLIPDVAFFMKDQKGCFVMQNRRACEFCGINIENESFGKTDYDFFPKDQADLYVEGDQRVMRTGEPMMNTICVAPGINDKMIVYSKVPVFNSKSIVVGVAGIYRIIEGAKYFPHDQRKFSTIVSFIHEKYMDPINVDDLASQANISKRQFNRQFNSLFHVTPNEYLKRVRVYAAREMLESSDRTITDIAQSCGFFDHSHFTKTFKSILAITPSMYRKNHISQKG